MKLKYIGENPIFESVLTEDKQVKFGGEVSPKYGWCVIYAGGPASGKSSSEKYNIPIVGKKLDVDEFKSLDKKNKKTNDIEPGFVRKFMGGKYYKEILNNPVINGDESKMSINDPDYVSVAHQVLDPFLDKVKDNMRNIGQYNSPDRLPNIIFDQTTKNIDKLIRMVSDIKQYGYKIAIVWVLTDMDKNMKAFKARNDHGRKMNPSLFMDIHPKVFNTMISVFDNDELLNSIDDFWVVINKYKPQKTEKQQLRQIRDTNVYHIPLEHGGLQQEKPVWDLIQKSLKDLDFYKGLGNSGV